MKIIYVLLFIVVFTFSVMPANAQQAQPTKRDRMAQEKILTATVNLRKETDKFFQDSVTIKFNQELNHGLEFYEVMGRGENRLKGNSKLITDLYYEPGLLASSVYVYNDTVEIMFARGRPDLVRLTNVLNRVIQIVHADIAPDSRLEVDNYNPLAGVKLDRPRYKIPPPVIKMP